MLRTLISFVIASALLSIGNTTAQSQIENLEVIPTEEVSDGPLLVGHDSFPAVLELLYLVFDPKQECNFSYLDEDPQALSISVKESLSASLLLKYNSSSTIIYNPIDGDIVFIRNKNGRRVFEYAKVDKTQISLLIQPFEQNPRKESCYMITQNPSKSLKITKRYIQTDTLLPFKTIFTFSLVDRE